MFPTPFPPPWLSDALARLGQSDPARDVWLWTAAFLIVYVVLTNLVWRIPDLREAGDGWSLLGARLAGFSLLPFLTLQNGLVSLREMGLSELDWVRRFGLGLAVAAAVVGLVAVARWRFQENVVTGRIRAPAGRQNRDTRYQTATIPLQAAAEQLLWALLRLSGSAFLLTAGLDAAPAAYWGPWLGFVLLCLSWLANPGWRHTMASADAAAPEIMRAVLALTTTVLFYVSGNLWLCWVVHSLAWLLVTRRAPGAGQAAQFT